MGFIFILCAAAFLWWTYIKHVTNARMDRQDAPIKFTTKKAGTRTKQRGVKQPPRGTGMRGPIEGRLWGRALNIFR